LVMTVVQFVRLVVGGKLKGGAYFGSKAYGCRRPTSDIDYVLFFHAPLGLPVRQLFRDLGDMLKTTAPWSELCTQLNPLALHQRHLDLQVPEVVV
jgi:hypothetical protein